MPASSLASLATVSLATRSDGNAQPDEGANFNNEVLIMAIVLMVCSLVAVTMSIMRTWHVLHRIDLHCSFLACAFVSAMVMSLGCIVLTTRGLGVHDHIGVISSKPGFQKPLAMVNCFYFTCNFFVKLALLSMYTKFTMEWWGVWSIRLMVLLSFVFWLGAVFATVLECIPLSLLWGGAVSGSCINIRMFYIANASIMIGLDSILYLMPIVFTWGITLSPSQTIGLRILFGLGFAVIASSAARLYIVYVAIRTNDVAYNWGRVFFTSLIENHLAINIACAPAIKSVFLNKIVPKVKTLLSRNSSRISFIWKKTPKSTTAVDSNSQRAWGSPSRTSTSTKFSKRFSDLFSGSTFKNSETTSNTMEGAQEDIELGFQNQSCDFIKDRTTSVASGFENTEAGPASKSIIYVSRNIDITEEHVTSSNAVAPAAASEEDIDKIEEHHLEQRA